MVGLLTAPQLAAANDDVEEQLQQMQERMSQLEEQLTATTDQLKDSERRADQQEELIQRAGIQDERAAESGMSSFLEKVEVGGWVAASYFWNFNGPGRNANILGNNLGFPIAPLAGGGPNNGTFGLASPFHPDHNTFQLDQLWFEMAKPATEESRGGFAADIVMGKTADTLTSSFTQQLTNTINGNTGVGINNLQTNGNLVTVYQAYAEYLAPVGPGVNVRAGRFATHIGAEVAQAPYNFNITRGLTYSILQPFNHVGVWASTEMDNGFSFGGGFMNDPVGNLNTDIGEGKVGGWHVGFGQENWSISHNGLYGKNGGRRAVGGFDQGIFNFLATWDPSENLSTYADLTYSIASDGGPQDQWAVGLALAGRLAVTEATGVALRGEYLFFNENALLSQGSAGVPGAPTNTDQQLWSITGTVDHALTENLTVKAEVRYEEGAQDGASDDVFYLRPSKGSTGGLSSKQVLVGAEMTYRF
jgi:hypothetical protein